MQTDRRNTERPGHQNGKRAAPRSRGDIYSEKAIELMALAAAMKEPLARSDLLDLHARYNLLAKLAS